MLLFVHHCPILKRPTMDTHRIFIAIDIPPKLKNSAEAELGGFYGRNVARVISKENWHVTVVFCGDITTRELENLKATAHKVAKETRSFKLSPDKITFAHNMVWVTFKNSSEFMDLSKSFSAFSSKESKPPLPHITLAKFKSFDYLKVKELLPQNGVEISTGELDFCVDSVNIMQSFLTPAGSEFKLLEKINLN